MQSKCILYTGSPHGAQAAFALGGYKQVAPNGASYPTLIEYALKGRNITAMGAAYRIIAILILAALLPVKSRSQQVACFYTNNDSSMRMEAGDELKNYNNFIVGELHDHPQTPAIKLALIKYLHEQKQVNDVFMEIGHAAAWLYNQYLLSGDTSFITSPPLVYAGTPAGRKFWAGLYEYNRASSHKITIHGIDFERMEFVKVLRLLKDPQSENFAGSAPDLAWLDTLTITNINDSRLVLTYERIKKDFLLRQKHYERCFGRNYTFLQEIMLNRATYKGYTKRDEAMAENTTEIIEKYQLSAIVMFVGKKHVGLQHGRCLSEILLYNRVFSGHTATIGMFQGKNSYQLELIY